MEFDKLIQKLSPLSREIFESAVACAAGRAHRSVEVEHWLVEAIQHSPVSACLTDAVGVDLTQLEQQLQKALESHPSDYDGFPKIAPEVMRWLFEAWLITSAEYETARIDPIHLLIALTDNPALLLRYQDSLPSLRKLNGEALRSYQESRPPEAADLMTAAQPKTNALETYASDLTALAAAGDLDEVLGRDVEIRQVIDVLCRRKQNNAILTGEAGVGKTAVAEGIAQSIVAGRVPELLKSVRLLSLDLGALQAGAGVKGEFEKRLKQVITEIKASSEPIVLFIDEAHTLIGAGNQSGAGDAANLLKPALARGELRTIAATTWSEYKQFFETDAALTRRFQVVKVEEPTEEQAKVMLRSAAGRFEAHHGVRILEEAIHSAVVLSHRYITGRQMPDKCISLLDTACARVALSHHDEPLSLICARRLLADLEFEAERLRQEAQEGESHNTALTSVMARIADAQAQVDTQMLQWTNEKALVDQIRQVRNGASSEIEHSPDSTAETVEKLKKLRAELTELQGDSPKLHDCVDQHVVSAVVSDWTGIPVGRMKLDAYADLMALESVLTSRVTGQDWALNTMARMIRASRAALTDPSRPQGVFMLVGPSGVGKTETALALAEHLYGSEKNLTVINMSEFKEEHKVSLLLGSPPGYVGYGKGGILTEAVRRRPYSVVLLDELEKAHVGVQEIFYQVFDKGILRDGEGRDIDFRNTLIIMTSNVASEQIEQLCGDPETCPEPEGLLEAIQPELRANFKPAFLGRVSVMPYFPLSEEALRCVAEQQIRKVQQRVTTQYGAALSFSQAAIDKLIEACTTSDIGARKIADMITKSVLPTLSEKLLFASANNQSVERVTVDIDNEGLFFAELIEKTEG